MPIETLRIRNYSHNDYPAIKKLYEESGWFDPETDDEGKIRTKTEGDPQSILICTDVNDLVGTISLIEDGRIAIFFRLITKNVEDAPQIRSKLLAEGEVIFKQRGYNEAHIIAPEEDIDRQNEYQQNGFQTGNPYRWMWKKLE